MQELAIIVAMAKNRCIGQGGALPWNLPEDLRFFKRTTNGHAIIMGRKTHESIGRALPGRRNIVVTRSRGIDFSGCEVAPNLATAVERARTTDAMPFVIGGAAIYREALSLASRIYLTEIDRDVAGDVFFPELDPTKWQEVARQRGQTPGVDFVTLERRTS